MPSTTEMKLLHRKDGFGKTIGKSMSIELLMKMVGNTVLKQLLEWDGAQLRRHIIFAEDEGGLEVGC